MLLSLLNFSVLDLVGRARGRYRVADPAVEGFELYIGVDAQPDLTASPDETYTTKPHTTAALTPGHTYQLVERFRNRFDLVSENVAAWSLVIAGDGSEEITPPSGPGQVIASAMAAGVVRITARYGYTADGDSQADTWLIFVTTDGSDPDPGVDVPIEVAMRKADGIAKLTYDTAAQSEGTVVKAIVRTRRSGSPDVDSENSDIVSATATLLGPAAVEHASAHLGEGDEVL